MVGELIDPRLCAVLAIRALNPRTVTSRLPSLSSSTVERPGGRRRFCSIGFRARRAIRPAVKARLPRQPQLQGEGFRASCRLESGFGEKLRDGGLQARFVFRGGHLLDGAKGFTKRGWKIGRASGRERV